MARRTHRTTQQGLTFVELMVGVALLATVLQLAVPMLADALASVTLRTAAEQLLSDLFLARTEALARNGRVAICRSADGVNCGGAAAWDQGWLVFEDANNDGLHSEGEAVIARRAAFAADLRILANQPVADYISYDGLGLARKTNGAFQAGTLTFCRAAAGQGEAREVILNAGGRPRMQRSTVLAC